MSWAFPARLHYLRLSGWWRLMRDRASMCKPGTDTTSPLSQSPPFQSSAGQPSKRDTKMSRFQWPQHQWSDPAGPGPSRSGAVSPKMGGLEAVGMHAGEMSPATTVAMSSDSRPTSVMPEGGDWTNTVRVSYLQRELKNIRVERGMLQRIEQLDAREAELERLVLEEMETLREGGGEGEGR